MTGYNLDLVRQRYETCDRFRQQRKLVGKHLGFALCADPVLDMVLELYAARARRGDLRIQSRYRRKRAADNRTARHPRA